MAGAAISSVAKFAGYSLAGATAIICIVALAVVMLILSIIPIYTPDSSAYGYGEVYIIPGFTIKATYTNVTANFTGGSLINLAGLSQLCTTILRAKNIPGFYACVATNFSAYGPTANTDHNSVVRRRELDDVALYEIGDMRLLFWNTCGNKRALGIWSTLLTQRRNSSCLAQRLASCKAFVTTPNAGTLGNIWSPISAGYTQLIVSNITGNGCSSVSITSISNVAYSNYGLVYGHYNNTGNPLYPGDCYLQSISPQWLLQSLISSQTSSNTSTCTSVIG